MYYKKITEFINKKKFFEEDFYPGISNEKLLETLTEKINEVALDFQSVTKFDDPIEKDYQEKIRIGLSKFEEIEMELDTEDKERVCNYFEELMDIVKLESSNGLLNEFMYGFDPNNLKEK